MYKTQTNINWDNIEQLKEILGTEALLDELCRAMSAQELKDNITHITACHDINVNDNGEIEL